MKIIYITNLYYPEITGGATISTQLVAESLAALGAEVKILTLRRTMWHGVEEINGIEVRSLPVANLYQYPPLKKVSKLSKLAWHVMDRNNPLMARQIKKILAEEKPDILHTQTLEGFSTSVWRAARSLNIPVIHTLRSYYLLCSRASLFNKSQKCESRCFECKALTAPRKSHSNGIQGVIGISNFILNRHLSEGYFSGVESTVIPNPVGTNHSYSNAEETPASLTDANRNPGGKLQLGFLGSIKYEKGLESVIHQLKTIPSHLYDFHIGGTGDENYVNSLKQAAEGLPVTFHGPVNASKFLSTLDALVVPSLWDEPFGRVTIEAFSHSLPVIGSKNGGTPELIEEGRTGYFFDPLTPGTLRIAIDKLTSNEFDLSQMKLNAFNESKKYEGKEIGHLHQSFYRKIIGNSARTL